MIIRLALLFSALLIVTSFATYIYTRDARYLRFAWQVGQFILLVILVFGVLFLLERYGLVAWRVLV